MYQKFLSVCHTNRRFHLLPAFLCTIWYTHSQRIFQYTLEFNDSQLEVELIRSERNLVAALGFNLFVSFTWRVQSNSISVYIFCFVHEIITPFFCLAIQIPTRQQQWWRNGRQMFDLLCVQTMNKSRVRTNLLAVSSNILTTNCDRMPMWIEKNKLLQMMNMSFPFFVLPLILTEDNSNTQINYIIYFNTSFSLLFHTLLPTRVI